MQWLWFRRTCSKARNEVECPQGADKRRCADASLLITNCIMKCLMLSLLLCSAAAAQTNLVPNGDFERDENGDGIPDFWAVAGAPHVKQQLVRDVGRDG
ncbi:MAG: hypothetical protein NZ781_12810, partial [Armatimonadetes bacterium]|nr:hypothetical protein [Armatimonadota bacterium]